MEQISNYVAMLFVFWSLLPVVLVFVGLLVAGTARHLPLDARILLTTFRWSGAMFVAAVSFEYPGEFGWVAALSGIGYAVLLGGMTLKAVAVSNFRQAPQVRAKVGHPE